MVASIVKSPTVALFFLLLHQLQQDIKISPPPIYHIKNERTNIDETLRPRGAVSSLNCDIFLLLFILKEVVPHFSTHSSQFPPFFLLAHAHIDRSLPLSHRRRRRRLLLFAVDPVLCLRLFGTDCCNATAGDNPVVALCSRLRRWWW